MSVVVVFVVTIPRKFWLIVFYVTLVVDFLSVCRRSGRPKEATVDYCRPCHFVSSCRLIVVFTISTVFIAVVVWIEVVGVVA